MTSMAYALNGGINRVLLWQKPDKTERVKFKEVFPFEDQESKAWTLAVGAIDLTGDMLPELYVANDFGPDYLYKNISTPGNVRFKRVNGNRSFLMPKSKTLGHDSFKGMGVDFSDLNGDGIFDIYVSNIAAEYSLQESHFMFVSQAKGAWKKHAPFKDNSEKLGLSRGGWGWDTRFGDFDNDGRVEAVQATGFIKGKVNRWPELHELAMANDGVQKLTLFWPKIQVGDDLSGNQANNFFVRAQDNRFYNLNEEVGLVNPYVTRGIATADTNGDGYLDMVFANMWEDSVFIENKSKLKIGRSHV